MPDGSFLHLNKRVSFDIQKRVESNLRHLRPICVVQQEIDEQVFASLRPNKMSARHFDSSHSSCIKSAVLFNPESQQGVPVRFQRERDTPLAPTAQWRQPSGFGQIASPALPWPPTFRPTTKRSLLRIPHRCIPPQIQPAWGWGTIECLVPRLLPFRSQASRR